MNGEMALSTGSQLQTFAPSDLVEAFLSGVSELTRRAYGQDLEDFRAFVGATDLDAAAGALLSRKPGEANAVGLAYRNALRGRGLAPATVNRRLAALRSLVKLGRTMGLVSWSLEVPNEKAQAYRDTRGPGRSGFQILMEQINGRQDPKAHRDRAILRLLYDLGLRRAEVCRLDLDDVDLEAGKVNVLGKGRRQKELLTLPAPTVEALGTWLAARGDAAGPLFGNFDRAGKGGRLTPRAINYLVTGLGRKVGLKVTPHGLRHTAITEAVKSAQANGIGLEEVRDFSRHADVKTLMIYRDRERNVQGQLAALVAAGAT